MSAETLATSSRPPGGRRQYLLDSGFQLKYIVRLAVLGGGGAGLLGALAYRVHQAAAERGPAPEVMAAGAQTLVWLTVLGAAVLAGVLGLYGLVFTHRVAGPVHVMSLYMAALAAGRYPRLRPLRRKDELHTFFERFRDAVERIREREAEEARLLADAISTLRPLATTAEAQAALSTLASLQARKRQAEDSSSTGGAPSAP